MAVTTHNDGSQSMPITEFLPVMCTSFVDAVDSVIEAEVELEMLNNRYQGKPPHTQHAQHIKRLEDARIQLIKVRNGAAEIVGREQIEIANNVKSSLIIVGGNA